MYGKEQKRKLVPELDNPKKPWKAVGAVVAAEASFLLGQQIMELPSWAVLLLNLILVGAVTFGIRNPKVGE